MKPIGKILKSKRESLGMTLLDMEKRIKIKREYISMLEKNEFDQLPNPDYAVGFIKKYAESVNLHAQKLIEEHQTELPVHKMTAKEAKKSLQSPVIQETQLLSPLFRLILLVAALCTLLWLASVYLFPHHHEWNAATINPSRNVAVETKKVENMPDKKKEPEKPVKKEEKTIVSYKSFDGATLSYTVKTKEPVSIRVTSKTPTWLQLRNDNNQSENYQNVNDRTLKVDKGTRTVTLIAGSTADLTVYLNGEKVDVPTNADTLITRTYQFNISK
ncbi:helix-turn-helix domain-containing protein [Macrococcus brunensis]|uniref:helix-turn-helix domain-containing protein n=1 Tax=Macrococcus brunensis TaxID=198483 RepID=UPI001EEFA5B1|nr:helix-turn-helix domain-containing protein [Macrococcus brunensis]ULG72939.1 helix-turn-helix domain-containing protein [Macrococcus brunensis]ULG75187.1 helix-turn-helix domain-containing protein [Macrococcus brunensis]